jgi:putative colanic acid biosynthesis UDP-glucose lipid carrier transferase
MILDFVLINATFFALAFFFKPELFGQSDMQTLNQLIILNLGWITCSLGCSIYNEKSILSPRSIINCSVWSWITCLLIFSLIVMYIYHPLVSYSAIITGLMPLYAILFLNRLLIKIIYNAYRKMNLDSNKVLIIGYNDLSIKLTEQLEAENSHKKIIGYCEEEPNIHELSRYPILGNIQNIMSVCNQYGTTEIYSTLTPDKNSYIEKLILAAEKNCIRFRIVPNLNMYLNNHTEVQYLNDIPIISQHREPLQQLNNRIIKRIFDIVFSLLVIVLINSWLMPLIALLIWLESGGKIFFLQKRSGENNIPFYIRKFRSMYINNTSDSAQAKKNDARVTKIGKFLRRTSLDEFPQFLNVLTGEMSIVGPRPHMLKHTDEYSQIIDQYMVRHFLKPGITGWAQVNGYRGETKNIRQMQKRIEHDIWYVENWSLQTDLKIILKTVYNIFKGEKNAY